PTTVTARRWRGFRPARRLISRGTRPRFGRGPISPAGRRGRCSAPMRPRRRTGWCGRISRGGSPRAPSPAGATPVTSRSTPVTSPPRARRTRPSAWRRGSTRAGFAPSHRSARCRRPAAFIASPPRPSGGCRCRGSFPPTPNCRPSHAPAAAASRCRRRSMTSRPDISASPFGTDPRWAEHWARAPRLVAESLVAVAEPIRTGLAAGPPASGRGVARALARSLLPAERMVGAPPWLLPGQARSFRRVVAALERYGGALLADPVGTGKTYVGLAVAALSRRRLPTACLVPATLADQWRVVAARVGVAVEVGTHQQASRGRLPATSTGLVIIDESQHFRNPLTRRYAAVAPWLVGRRVLLLSATPIVNRLADLAHQLLLGVRDDALQADGIVSLRTSLASGAGLSALGRVVVEDTAEAGPRPGRSHAACLPAEDENLCAAR